MAQSLSPLRLPVRTESGQHLGEVVDVSIEPRTHQITHYHVKPSRLVPDVVWSPLLIHYSQVVSIDRDGLVVDETTARQAQATPRPQPTA